LIPNCEDRAENNKLKEHLNLSLLEIKDLKVHFTTDHGVVIAIDRIDFSIEKGEIVGLVGESGCGKTTIGKSILRVLPEPGGKIVSGAVFFDEKNLLNISEKEFHSKIRGRAITVIPQDPSTYFNPVFTIGSQFLDIIKYKVNSEQNNDKRRKGTPKRPAFLKNRTRKNKIVEMLKSVQISTPEKQLHKYAHEFSGGQRQRIMIAMALAPKPALIIADEATTALDVTIEAQILVLLRNLTKTYNTSVLFITHDLGVANEICDRITVMYAGQIMESAPTESFFSSPCHPYTRGLLDSLPNPKGNIKTIKGEIPPLINPPKGCRFHPRCPRMLPRCKEKLPETIEIIADHFVRCFNHFTD
jgi:oligopeptide/dipeptide ABC transporter ATP-binding protein